MGGERCWADDESAPGDESVRLRAVRVFQDGIEGPTEDVDIARDVHVEIEYQARSGGSPLYAAIHLRDTVGTAVFASSTAPGSSAIADEWHGKPHPAGVYRSRCTIPGSLLNEGRYHVTAIVAKDPGQVLIREENALPFHVHDSGEMRTEYYGLWIGTVRPRLAWRTERVA
ncbi:MAG: Wzt carbohydrate-binding domain-containing protein [Deltaproteobacteria bacterium]|nr:Wzt carbohydrate-binding domain-containing protein [Deltaproteobacteria bacterium]